MAGLVADGSRWTQRTDWLTPPRGEAEPGDVDLAMLAIRDEMASSMRGPESGSLRAQPDATLQRPFVVIPGFRTRDNCFTPLFKKLTAGGRNGGRVYYVRNGECFDDRACHRPLGAIPPQARIFEVVFPSRHYTPDQAATSLHFSLRAIRHATGEAPLDVEGYSMGGLTARVELDRGGRDISRLLMLATPNHGCALANLGHQALRSGVKLAMRMAHLVPEEMPALEWMMSDGKKAMDSRLAELNRRWPEQCKNVEAVCAVGTDFHVTMCSGWPGFAAGDGVVTTRSQALPDGQLTILRQAGHKRHGKLNQDPQVYGEMVKFFGWNPQAIARHGHRQTRAA